MEPYTNVVCPDCGEQSRVKCDLGHYKLIGRHAEGGMSKLFVANDTTLDREVAIKILNAEYCQDEKRMKQFEDEALITAAISHPHVVRVFTVGKAFERFYIAMELVSGESLEQKMAREGAISEDQILPLCQEIISGLRAAKEEGLIHRDIKPGNILFDANNHVKIVDFGLALVTQGGVAKADEIWATPYYVPPEALLGEEEDFRSDMYALGATLYHALSGKPSIPEHTKSSRTVLDGKKNIESLASIAPWLKPETCQLVEQAMAFQPEDRFASYQEMEDARARANHVIDELGVSAPVACSARYRRRRRDKIVLTTLVMSALIAILCFVFFKKKPKDSADSSIALAKDDITMFTDDSSYSPELAAHIGKLFHQSHQYLREGRYEKAQVIFEDLMNDERLLEPAASWAGVESIISLWLAGDTRKAELATSALLEHIKSNELDANSDVRAFVQDFAGVGLITDFKQIGDRMVLLQMMAVALKNWEIGALDAAVRIFEAVKSRDLPEQSPLLVYRDISKKYLADYARIQELKTLPSKADKDQVTKHLAVLQKVTGNLKTKGRARFHIQVWQTRAERHLAKLERESKEAALKAKEEELKRPTYQDRLAQFRKLVADSKFADARKLLEQADASQNDQKKKEAWIYLSKCAGLFLQDLSRHSFKTALNIKVLTVSGGSYTQVVASNEEGLKLKKDDLEVFLQWNRIEPESILEIYRGLFGLSLETLYGQQLTERAICYSWLMGLSAVAEPAVEALSEVNGNFKKRWQASLVVIVD
ncbi:MAG: protein kinase [Akkermansiaceae bacterium]|nr:protein kinase [Akkermansiaceae bacterium]